MGLDGGVLGCECRARLDRRVSYDRGRGGNRGVGFVDVLRYHLGRGHKGRLGRVASGFSTFPSSREGRGWVVGPLKLHTLPVVSAQEARPARTRATIVVFMITSRMFPGCFAEWGDAKDNCWLKGFPDRA